MVVLSFSSGDCDSDDECGEGLVCFQRVPFDRVPGCDDGENESSNTDFCVPEGLTLAPIPTWEPTWEPTFNPTFDNNRQSPVAAPVSFPNNVVDPDDDNGGGEDDDEGGDDDDEDTVDGFGDIVCGLIGVFC